MAGQDDFRTPEQYEETVDPKNPPNSVANPATRRAAFWSYVGPILVLFAVFGIGLTYWMSNTAVHPTADNREGQPIGTAGERSPGESTAGGSDPAPRPNNTRDELEYRGADSSKKPVAGFNEELTLKGLDEVTQSKATARRVEIRDVEVESIQGDTFWARQGHAKVAVIAPAETPQLRAGMHVNVSGTTEADGSGSTRVRATNVEVRK
jgi:hypothetical protein